MSYITDICTNLAQNQLNFQLPSIENKLIIFKRGYFIKELNPIQENPNLLRTVTVKCTYKNCKYIFILFIFLSLKLSLLTFYSKKFYKQQVFHNTSNYITHYKTNYKLVPLSVLKSDLNSKLFNNLLTL
jgi:hypothetical protein